VSASSLTLTGLFVHPVKSTAVRPLRRSAVLPRGLADDRSWVLSGTDGVMVTARTFADLFRITADTPATDPTVTADLRLRAEGAADLDVAVPDGDPVPVQVHSNHLTGVPAGDEAQAWVREVLGRDDLRLLWCRDPQARRLNPARSRPGDHTAYADGYPVTIASEASLRQLNDWITETTLERGEEPREPLDMDRFRPNVVIDGDEPFAEEGWAGVRVGDVRFRTVRPTDRCVMTTIDPTTLDRHPEPIRTLARHRRWDGKVWFAVNLIPVDSGTIEVGDVVEPLTEVPEPR